MEQNSQPSQKITTSKPTQAKVKTKKDNEAFEPPENHEEKAQQHPQKPPPPSVPYPSHQRCEG